MKKLVITCILIFGLQLCIRAQNGLERVIVERYYKSTAADTVANPDGGRLPVGSVTYRVFADLLPGYNFQAIYGIPGHELRIATTTLFFNNEDRGDITPSYTKTQARSNTVMLDSWISAGAACSGQIGVPKDEDFDSTATVVNNYSPQVLQNDDPSCGIPVKDQDGMVSGSPCNLTVVGVSTEIAVFGSQNDGTNGPVFSTVNGSCACLGGAMGADTAINKVLIGQFTTDGIFSFKLNIQVGTPSGGVQNFVAENPTGLEILDTTLMFTSPPDTGLSVNELTSTQAADLLIYPNPGNGTVHLILPVNSEPGEKYTVKLISTDGRELQSGYYQISQNKLTLQIPEALPEGIYFIQVTAMNSLFVSKFSLINN